MRLAMPEVSRGEPIRLAISWLRWNSAQSILTTARGVLEQRLYLKRSIARLLVQREFEPRR
jgi:hypothetical protein